MTTQRRKIILATLLMISIFAAYEYLKTLFHPEMSAFASHVISTIVVGIITLFTVRYGLAQQTKLLKELERSNSVMSDTIRRADRDEDLLRSIVSSVAEGLLITDCEYKVVLINDAARNFLNVGQRPAMRLIDVSRDPEVHKSFSQVVNTGKPIVARVETRAGDVQGVAQSKRVLRLHAAPLRLSDGRIDGVVGAFIDISKQELLERIRREFVSNVSHELRTPLASISAYVETLMDGGLDDEDNSLRFLNTIHRNSERMKVLVDEISELSAIESGAVQLTVHDFNLRDLVKSIFNGLSPRAEKNNVTLENLILEDLDISGDRKRVEQILVNLIENAIKYNRPGGHVYVNVEDDIDEKYRIIHIRDTGTGISRESLSRVFERFYRVDKARSREAGGTGLGLSIVKHLTLLHGGEAYVESEFGVGSIFSIKLPKQIQHDHQIVF